MKTYCRITRFKIRENLFALQMYGKVFNSHYKVTSFDIYENLFVSETYCKVLIGNMNENFFMFENVLQSDKFRHL